MKMKNPKILTTMILTLSLTVCLATVSGVEPMGTAFTYQGRLTEDDNPADGLHDFKFSLFDDSVAGRQIGTDLYLLDVDVANGYFTVELDFGPNTFNGYARWLQIGVRPGELEDPNEYTPLSPRQELTPTPYATYADKAAYAYNASTDGDWAIYGDNLYSLPIGNIGIGTNTPGAKLDVETNFGQGGAATIGSSTNSAVGDFAVAMGYDTTADGNSSTAMGYQTTAGGNSSTAMGILTEAAGPYSTAIGYDTNADGENSTAMGLATIAGGYCSTAMGRLTTAGGSYSTAMGYYSIANGARSTAMGWGAETIGYDSIALGYYTTAGGDYSVAMGQSTTAGGGRSTAMGYDTTADGISSTAMGHSTTASGFLSTAMGRGIEAAGDYSVAIALSDQTDVIVTQDNTMAIMGGNVGIGTTSPSHTLHVVGNIAYTGSIYEVSDRRLKENISPLENSVEKLSCLKGIYFNNKGDSLDKREVGVIAQDVEKVLPELVSMDKQGYKSVDYTKLSAVLIEAVKEQQKQIENLQSEVKALKAIQQHQLVGEKEVQR